MLPAGKIKERWEIVVHKKKLILRFTVVTSAATEFDRALWDVIYACSDHVALHFPHVLTLCAVCGLAGRTSAGESADDLDLYTRRLLASSPPFYQVKEMYPTQKRRIYSIVFLFFSKAQ